MSFKETALLCALWLIGMPALYCVAYWLWYRQWPEWWPVPRIKAEKCRSNRTARRDADWCPGCGLYAFTHGGEHRADCLTRPAPCEVCRYYPAVHGRHRDDCPHRSVAESGGDRLQ